MPTNMSLAFLIVLSDSDDPQKFQQCMQSLDLQTDKEFSVTLVINGSISSQHKQIIDEYISLANNRISPIFLDSKLSFTQALNIGLKSIKSYLTARLDPDDIALPNRVAITKDLFRTLDIDILGSFIYEFSSDSNNYYLRTYPLESELITKKMLWNNQLAHSAVTFKTSNIQAIGGYPEIFKQEDYGLWLIALQKNLIIMNAPEPVTIMNIDGMFKRRGGVDTMMSEILLIELKKTLGNYNILLIYLSFLIRFTYRISPINLKKILHRLTRDKSTRNNKVIK